MSKSRRVFRYSVRYRILRGEIGGQWHDGVTCMEAFNRKDAEAEVVADLRIKQVGQGVIGKPFDFILDGTGRGVYAYSTDEGVIKHEHE